MLDYWREESDSTDGTWWVEFDSLAGGSNTFYVYYGKTGDTDASSGADTFIAFDDFERGSDGDEVGGSWTEDSGVVEISTGQKWGGTRSMKLECGAADAKSYISVTPGDTIAIRYRHYCEAGVTVYTYQGDGVNRVAIDWEDAARGGDVTYLDSAWLDTGTDVTHNTWQLVEFCDFRWAGNTVDLYLDGTRIKDATPMPASSYAGDVFRFNAQRGAGNDAWVDDFLVRNYRESDQPAWSSWGAEEAVCAVETFDTLLSADPPDVPTLLSPGTTIVFKWNASSGATKYWLEVNTAASFNGTSMFNSELGNVTSQEVTGFSVGTTYYWRVMAGNDNGWSDWSSVRRITIEDVP
jgi:hypothetical protein